MDILAIIVSALVSACMSAGTGLFVRLAIERKYSEAKLEARQRRERRVRFAGLRQEWQQAAGEVFYHLVRNAQGWEPPRGKPVNGDLTDAFARLKTIEAELKQMESTYAAEAQED